MFCSVTVVGRFWPLHLFLCCFSFSLPPSFSISTDSWLVPSCCSLLLVFFLILLHHVILPFSTSTTNVFVRAYIFCVSIHLSTSLPLVARKSAGMKQPITPVKQSKGRFVKFRNSELYDLIFPSDYKDTSWKKAQWDFNFSVSKAY